MRLAALLIAAALSLPAQQPAAPQARIILADNGAQLPDPLVTPGSVLTTDLSVICVPGYSKTVRHTSGKLKAKVYKSYGIKTHKSGEYEIDHSISLELGGADVEANLWPQPYATPGAHEKDALENLLHAGICDGSIPILEAQRCISANWVECAKKYGILSESPVQ